MYEEDSVSRIHRGNFANYDGVNSRSSNRHEYRRASPPNRQRNPPPRDPPPRDPPPRDPPPRTRNRSRSPREGFHDRVYDDYAARDYNDYHDNGGMQQGYGGNDRPSRDRDDFEWDSRGREGRRSAPQSRSYRNERSNSRDMSRDRGDLRDRIRENRRDSGRDYQGDRDSGRNYGGDGERNFRDNRSFREDERERPGPRIIDRGFQDDRVSSRNYRNEDFPDNERNNRSRRDDDRGGRFSDSDDRDRRRRDDDSDADRYRGWTRDDTYSQLHAPSQTVILQNIGSECTEEKIEGVLKKVGFDYRSIAVIRDRDTGENKGFAFVEFFDVETAEKWMEDTMREIRIDDKLVMLNYSKRKNVSTFRDWNCIKCDVLNFGSRKKYSHDRNVTCYQCGALQNDGDDEEVKNNKRASARDEVEKAEACNVLMVRGMDITTTEEMIRTAISPLTTYPIYDVRLIRDKVTDMSRGFAFVEMGELEHAKELLEIIENSDPPFLIGKRRITIGYARHGYNTPSGNTKGEKPSKSSDRSGGQTSGWTDTSAQQKNISNAAAVALSTANAAGTAPAAQSTYTYDATSGYYYDTSTGLYYDPNTGYHYNGTTGQWMYWTGTRYQAVNPDGTPVGSTPAATPAVATASAVAAPSAQISAAAVPTADAAGNASAVAVADASSVPNTVPQAATTAQVPPAAIAPKKDIVEMSFQKPKTARKIAKDMERWAKKMNTATEAKKVAVKAAQDELRLLAQKEEELRQQILQEVNVSSIVVANNAIASLPKDSGVRSLFVPENEEEGSVLKLGSALSTPKTKKPTSNVVAVDIPEPEDDDYVDESKFVDATKMACLLCKRQFPSKDVLTKHLQMSQLHKDNLEKYKQSKQV